MFLPELLIEARNLKVKEGTISGYCVICRRWTEYGHDLKKVFSSNFTMWSYLYSGDCVCEECSILFSDQIYRRHSWVVWKQGFEIIKRKEAKQVLFDPPDPPFFINIIKIGQKQQWIKAIEHVAYSRDFYWFAHEDYGLVQFVKRKARLMDSIIKKGLEVGLTKTELRGNIKPKTCEKLLKKNCIELLDDIKRFKNNQLWEVLIDVS